MDAVGGEAASREAEIEPALALIRVDVKMRGRQTSCQTVILDARNHKEVAKNPSVNRIGLAVAFPYIPIMGRQSSRDDSRATVSGSGFGLLVTGTCSPGVVGSVMDSNRLTLTVSNRILPRSRGATLK